VPDIGLVDDGALLITSTTTLAATVATARCKFTWPAEIVAVHIASSNLSVPDEARDKLLQMVAELIRTKDLSVSNAPEIVSVSVDWTLDAEMMPEVLRRTT
jgi:hypothetical protein